MEELFNNLRTHYDLPATAVNFIGQTNTGYFEIDDIGAELYITEERDSGTAKFLNGDGLVMSVANYEKFVTAMPNPFQRRRGRCDFVMVCDRDRYFILGEIKDSTEIKHWRKESKKQLISSLTTLLEVPQIADYANSRAIRRCCYFNKQAKAPEETSISAPEAFSRLANLFPDGFKMENKAIEELGFEFYQYTGSQTFVLSN